MKLMHPYATNSDERKLVPLYIAVASILIAWLLHSGLALVNLIIPWWVDAPSVLGFYGLFFKIFDKYIWRFRILRRIGVVRLPDLNGIWKGHVASSFDNYKTKCGVQAKILQNWTSIRINLETENSESHSMTAAIIIENPGTSVLSYEYLNEPKANAKTTMHIHKGTARLLLSSDNKVLTGEYYTGRDRQEFGILSLERLEPK